MSFKFILLLRLIQQNIIMRHLSEYFLNALKNGTLKPVLDRVHSDKDLDLEFRRKEVTVYYKGLRLFSIKEGKSV